MPERQEWLELNIDEKCKLYNIKQSQKGSEEPTMLDLTVINIVGLFLFLLSYIINDITVCHRLNRNPATHTEKNINKKLIISQKTALKTKE